MDQLRSEDPTRVGPYRLIARLGEGGMGLVYLGRDEGGRTVAVKVVQAEYAGHHEFRRRFAREVAAARRVGGSWTAAVLDADPDAAVPWVATQYIPGPDLSTVVAKDFGPLPEHSVHFLASRLALALQTVHGAGLIHRDLKPSNVLVTVDGPRVIDFGIARAMDSLSGDSLHTRTGMLIGSPGFMSPEQVRGLELTPASDVFCLGAVLVYAATGCLLFGAAETGLNAHLFRVAEDEADLTGVPESLAGLVRACLHKDPAERPTPRQVAERAQTERDGEWLPGTVLAQLGRHAAQLLDFAPVPRPEAPVDAPTDASAAAAQRDPRVALARSQAQPQPQVPPQPQTPVPMPPPPAFAPTTPFSEVDVVVEPSSGPHRGRWWGLAVLVLAQLLVLFQADVGMWPFIEADLHLSSRGPLTLVHGCFFGGLLLFGGQLADRVGGRRTLVTGLVGFALGSLLGGTAADPAMMFLARALQGVFAALITPSALALVSTGFTDPKERRRAFGIYASVSAGGAAFAMLPTAWLLEAVDWRMCFYGAVPLSVIALIGVLNLVHDGPRRPGARFDVFGALLGFAGVAALIFGLSHAEWDGWNGPLAVVPLGSGALVLAIFLWWQTRASNPLVPPYIVRDRGRVGCYLTLILSGLGGLGFSAALVDYLVRDLGYAPMAVGTAFLLLFVVLLIGATQVSGRLLHRVPPRVLVVAGLATTALGLALLSGGRTDGGFPAQILSGMLVIGFGTGIAAMPLFTLATDAIAPQHSGAASAALTTSQYLGGAISTALLSTMAYPSGLWFGVGGTLLAAVAAGLLVGVRTRTARSGSTQSA
ncbi:MDR family MFS transporter [Streptomyces sp. NRAIS4]